MGLPRWRIEIHKSLENEEWANDYLTDDVTIEDAHSTASLILNFEQHIHQTVVLFTYMRISTTVKDDRVFRHVVINEPGLLASGDHLPLYCVARMDMACGDSDPCRKYYRLPVNESGQTNAILTTDTLGSLNSLIATHLVTPSVLGHIVSGKGNSVQTASFNPNVQMRQLHRHKRKKIPAGA